MFDKKILFVFLITLVLVLTACSKIMTDSYDIEANVDKKTTVKDAQKPSEEKVGENGDSNRNSEISGESNNITYEIIKSEYTDKGIKINFPQITALSDDSKQKKINNLIKSNALEVLEYYENVDGKVTLDINYNITWKGPNLLSIQYTGVGNIKGAAYPRNIFYTTNIDIRKEAKLRLIDIVNIDENFVEKFKEGKYITWDAELNAAIDFIKDDVYSYDLINELKNADSLGEENTSSSFSYFTHDSLGISIGVAHAIGDHAEFEIKYDEIKDSIKAENEIWEDFSN